MQRAPANREVPARNAGTPAPVVEARLLAKDPLYSIGFFSWTSAGHGLGVFAMVRLGAFVLAGSLTATAAHAQLLSERVEGTARLCRYAPTGLASPLQIGTHSADDLEPGLREAAERQARSRESGEREVAIDAARTCPASFPDQQEQRTIIPTYATLESERRVNGELLCSYQYLRRIYVISLGRRSICPYTPVGLGY